MKIHRTVFLEYLRSRLWALPVLFIVLVAAGSRLTLYFDEQVAEDRAAWYLFPGSPASARNLLSSIASATLTITAVVFSVTVLILQLASSQLSPRVMRNFLRDLLTQVTLGAFVATFVLSLLILREIDIDAETASVPALSIWFTFTMTVIDIFLFIAYINHMAHAIRPTTVMEQVAEETRRALERPYPAGIGQEAAAEPSLLDKDFRVVEHDGRAGVLVSVDGGRLLDICRQLDIVIALVPRPGDFVPHGGQLFLVWRSGSNDYRDRLGPAVALSRDRSIQQDPLFGLRQLVDIAERALSPGVNDPTTAVQSLDFIHNILRTISSEKLPSPFRFDGEGRLRLILPTPDWDAYVALALDEILQYGATSLQVYARLNQTLADLEELVPAERRGPISARLHLLEALVAGTDSDNPERFFARTLHDSWLPKNPYHIDL